MDIRAMEDLLVCIFDPLLTIDEKADQLRLHCTDSVQTFDEAGVEGIHGVVVAFAVGVAFQLVVIPGSGR